MMRHASTTTVERSRRSFTLVELLVVITIILMLAGLGLAVVAQARESARLSRTRSTVTKISRLILHRYAAYRTRRVPISTTGMPPQQAAVLRLAALRQLMRLEMPDRFSDIVNSLAPTDPGYLPASAPPPPPPYGVNSVPIPAPDGATILGTMPRPAISVAYRTRYETSPPSPTYGAAECLYMILCSGASSVRDQFSDLDIGDVDGDGWPEFIDGWGNPIYWIRWAPPFNDTDLQPVIIPPNALPPPAPWNDSTWDSAKQTAADDAHDPFDTRKVHPGAWLLVPLVYSAGPDGIYDISSSVVDSSGNPYVYRGNVYSFAIGLPQDMDNTSATASGPANSRLDHYDNIHNHRVEVEQ